MLCQARAEVFGAGVNHSISRIISNDAVLAVKADFARVQLNHPANSPCALVAHRNGVHALAVLLCQQAVAVDHVRAVDLHG